MFRMKKKITFLMLALLVAFTVISGCTRSKETAATTDKKASGSGESIKLALSPWPGWFVWYLVKEKGFFEKNGVKVDLVWFPVYSDSLAALSTGKVDANSQTLSDTLTPASKGIGVKAVLVNDNSNGGDGIVVKPEIASLKDLKGKKVATELGTVDHLLMLTALSKQGLKETDVDYTNMTVNDAGPAFISGNLDAAVLWEPFLTKALQEGKGKLLFSSKDTPGLIPDLLVFRANPDDALKIMAKAAETPLDDYKAGVDSVKIFQIEDNLKAFQKADNYTSLTYTSQKTAEFLKGLDMLSSIPKAESILDSHFVEEVAKERKK
jgi:NitT/TauT family transport system substrate-binding protein